MSGKMDAAFLKCEVRPGMFSDERVVTVKEADGELESFFVPKDAVIEDRSVVRVQVHGSKGQTVIASLSTGEGKAYVTVKPGDLENH